MFTAHLCCLYVWLLQQSACSSGSSVELLLYYIFDSIHNTKIEESDIKEGMVLQKE